MNTSLSKSQKLLVMAQNMDKKIKSIEAWNMDERTETKWTDHEIEICKKASKRLWNYYLVVKENEMRAI